MSTIDDAREAHRISNTYPYPKSHLDIDHDRGQVAGLALIALVEQQQASTAALERIADALEERASTPAPTPRWTRPGPSGRELALLTALAFAAVLITITSFAA